MTELVATAFPFLVAFAAVVAFVAMVRLDRRMSRAAHSAGARTAHDPQPLGQQRTPWELQSIDDQLRIARSNTTVRGHDLAATVNRLISAAGFDDPGDQLSASADEAHLASAIGRIETHLGLPPLEVPESTRHERGTNRR